MAKSSIHIASGKAGYFAHNSRERQTKNSIFHDEQNFCSCTQKEAFEIYKSELQKRAEAYTNRTGQKLQKKAITHLSAIVNLNKEHTEKDLKKVCDFLEQTFDTKVMQYSIHRDEGYVDEDGTAHKNYHAHVEFLGLDSKGKSIRRKLTKKALIDLQSKVAELLNMKRGVNYTKERKRRTKRLDTYEYKAHKEQEQKAKREVLAKQKDLKEQMKELREQLKQAHAERKDYAKLEQLNRELREQIKAKDLSLEQLKQQLQEYKQQNIDIKLAKLPPLEVDEIEISTGLFKKETIKVYNIESVNKLHKQAQKLHKQAELLQKSSQKEVPELREKLKRIESQKEYYFRQAYERRKKIEQIEQELDSVENIDIVATDETREALNIVQNETQEYIASYDTKNAVQKIASFFVKFYRQAKKRIESLLSENKRLRDENIKLQEKIAQNSITTQKTQKIETLDDVDFENLSILDDDELSKVEKMIRNSQLSDDVKVELYTKHIEEIVRRQEQQDEHENRRNIRKFSR